MDAETRGVVVDAVSGFIAGAACTLVFQPLDTILVRQQYFTLKMILRNSFY